MTNSDRYLSLPMATGKSKENITKRVMGWKEKFISKAGREWRVGDGRAIGVFTHKWLHHTPIPLHEGALDLCVRELIDKDSRQWDRGKLEAMFTQNTVQEILTIPLTDLHSHDKLVWTENKAHKFLVKTAYQLALCLKNLSWAEHSTAWDYYPVWNKI
ncbi:hypothetical protein SO802_024845 [Lithocarpus litseifolius]|uniref:Uncharacterized protein n=1 Tax=Lithocarpus litseifolius TaxID=425828 RepID=A0AAW2CAR5_9ROSI